MLPPTCSLDCFHKISPSGFHETISLLFREGEQLWLNLLCFLCLKFIDFSFFSVCKFSVQRYTPYLETTSPQSTSFISPGFSSFYLHYLLDIFPWMNYCLLKFNMFKRIFIIFFLLTKLNAILSQTHTYCQLSTRLKTLSYF